MNQVTKWMWQGVIGGFITVAMVIIIFILLGCPPENKTHTVDSTVSNMYLVVDTSTVGVWRVLDYDRKVECWITRVYGGGGGIWCRSLESEDLYGPHRP